MLFQGTKPEAIQEHLTASVETQNAVGYDQPGTISKGRHGTKMALSTEGVPISQGEGRPEQHSWQKGANTGTEAEQNLTVIRRGQFLLVISPRVLLPLETQLPKPLSSAFAPQCSR